MEDRASVRNQYIFFLMFIVHSHVELLADTRYFLVYTTVKRVNGY